MEQNGIKNKTLIVIVVTLVTMFLEVAFGLITCSMALLADGIHMGMHALALFVTFLACVLAIKHKEKEQKYDAMGAYTNSILLGITAVGIIFESIKRFISPENIAFNSAISVAVIGLVINLICIFIMDNHHHGACCDAHCGDGCGDGHCDCEGHFDGQCDECDENSYRHGHCDGHFNERGENLNFKSAYLHILADALTSIFAIAALLAGKFFGLTFFDPLIGILGGVIILKWAYNLIKSSSKILLE